MLEEWSRDLCFILVSSFLWLCLEWSPSHRHHGKKKNKNGRADGTDRNSISLETGVMGALWAIGHTQSQGELTQESIPLIQGLTHSCPALVLSGSAGSHSLWPTGLSGSSVHGILQARILERLPWHPPGDVSDPGMNPCLLYCRWILYLLSHHGSQGNKS